MSESKHEFRDRLLKVEEVTPSMKEQYIQRIHVISEKIAQHRYLIVLSLSIISLAYAVFLGGFSIDPFLPGPDQWGPSAILVRLIVLILGLVFLALGILGIKYYRRRPPNPIPPDPRIVAIVKKVLPWLVLGSFVTVGFVFIGTLNSSSNNFLIGIGVFWVVVTLLQISYSIQKSENRTREKLLEIEYHLAELSETLNTKKSPNEDS
jgi:hypothetical protein